MTANPNTLLVTQKDMLTPDIALFELASHEGRELAAFSAGAHLSGDPVWANKGVLLVQ